MSQRGPRLGFNTVRVAQFRLQWLLLAYAAGLQKVACLHSDTHINGFGADFCGKNKVGAAGS